MIRVLIVDDCAVAREYLTHVLDRAPGIHVVGEARDGEEALAAVARLRPDLITMDVNMPRMDGLTATREIMQRFPTPIVVVTGNEITTEVRATFESLDSGALALVPRPSYTQGAQAAEEATRLVDVVRLMAEVKVVRRWGHRTTLGEPGAVPIRPGRVDGGPEVVIFGASTGGPHALKEIWTHLPPSFTVPLVVVQHIAAGFVDGFVAWIQQVTGRPVHVAKPGAVLQPGAVYVPPEGCHLLFTQEGRLRPHAPLPGETLVPAVSQTFNSAAHVFRQRAVGVLLTGMGRDGADGLLAMRRAGALTLAQDAASSVVFGMPGEAVRLGAAELVLPPERIGATLAGLMPPAGLSA